MATPASGRLPVGLCILDDPTLAGSRSDTSDNVSRLWDRVAATKHLLTIKFLTFFEALSSLGRLLISFLNGF